MPELQICGYGDTDSSPSDAGLAMAGATEYAATTAQQPSRGLSPGPGRAGGTHPDDQPHPTTPPPRAAASRISPQLAPMTQPPYHMPRLRGGSGRGAPRPRTGPLVGTHLATNRGGGVFPAPSLVTSRLTTSQLPPTDQPPRQTPSLFTEPGAGRTLLVQCPYPSRHGQPGGRQCPASFPSEDGLTPTNLVAFNTHVQSNADHMSIPARPPVAAGWLPDTWGHPCTIPGCHKRYVRQGAQGARRIAAHEITCRAAQADRATHAANANRQMAELAGRPDAGRPRPSAAAFLTQAPTQPRAQRQFRPHSRL